MGMLVTPGFSVKSGCDEMTIEIIVWFIVLILGLGIIVFSSQIATFIHNVNLELRRELTGSTKEKNPKKNGGCFRRIR